MAFELDRVRRGEIERLITTVPPRNLKSICTSVALPAFALGHDPTCKFICVSYAQNLAEKHANDCRALMRSGMYREVFPTRISAAKDTQLEFTTTAGGYRLTTSAAKLARRVVQRDHTALPRLGIKVKNPDAPAATRVIE